MAKAPNAVEILPKISAVWVGCTSVTDRRQTDARQHIANVNVSSRSSAKNRTMLSQVTTKIIMILIETAHIYNIQQLKSVYDSYDPLMLLVSKAGTPSIAVHVP